MLLCTMIAALLLLPVFLPGHAARAGEVIAVARVVDHEELVLADGRMLRLAGLASIDDAGMLDALRRHSTRGVRVVALAEKPDRWGRLEAVLAVQGSAGEVLLAELLVEEGVAVWRGDSPLTTRMAGSELVSALSGSYRERLLALEGDARRARRGGWGGASPMPLAAEDRARLKQYEGRYVVIVGRVTSVGERRKMTFINFGDVWSRDFSVFITRDDWDRMAKEGVTGESLKGRRVMVRGDLLFRKTTRGSLDGGSEGSLHGNTGRAPVIRLSVIHGISIQDSD